MISLGIIDCFYLLAHIIAGVMTILHNRIHEVVERLVGSLILSSWIGMAGMIFALALNRTIVLTPVRLGRISEKTFFLIFTILIWLFYLTIIGVHLTNEGKIVYQQQESIFRYAVNSFNYKLEKCESYCIFALLVLSFVCYLGIALWIVYHKNSQVGKHKIEHREIRVLIQAIIIFAYMTIEKEEGTHVAKEGVEERI
ncbi:hypothetical protein L596_026531 [Steinernema carpocapsae]|uniref:7TM GPCR serpentine receptor class x (Srx) domain-containing protein n=1 Tax=Steinernema carpocapsae TaxID=34508 RepID=A0A4U5M1M1_STECR|nr:hypothetical protein L596_026531 [Steinernema carpocapsae]